MRSYHLVSPVLLGLLNRFHILHREPMWKKFPLLQNYELNSSRRFGSNTIRFVLFVPSAFRPFYSLRMDGTNCNGAKSASTNIGDTHPWSGTDPMELPEDSWSAVGKTEWIFSRYIQKITTKIAASQIWGGWCASPFRVPKNACECLRVPTNTREWLRMAAIECEWLRMDASG